MASKDLVSRLDSSARISPGRAGSRSPADTQASDWETFLAEIARGKTVAELGPNRPIFLQGETSDSVFYLRKGKVKLAVTSEHGREAIIAIFDAGEFFGEGCLADQPWRMESATTLTECHLVRIEKSVMVRLLHDRHEVAELVVNHMVSRNLRYQEDLADQLFNFSEKRLARSLLLLAHVDKQGKAEPVLARVNQDTLAQMVGTTRSRVSHFMNKFKQNGFVEYNSNGGLTVHGELLSVVGGSPYSGAE